MDTPKEAELVKNALEHYKNRLQEFKRKKTKENDFHSSMFPDIDKEIEQITDTIPKTNPPYHYNGKDGRIMERALETYKCDLEKIQEETKKGFPKIREREIEELKDKIKRVLRNL